MRTRGVVGVSAMSDNQGKAAASIEGSLLDDRTNYAGPAEPRRCGRVWASYDNVYPKL